MNVDASNSNAANSETANVELDQLVGLFFDEVSNLGSFKEVNHDDVTEPSRMLLAHDHHMTVHSRRPSRLPGECESPRNAS